ncbi:hypothetical protein D3C73_1671990 [compost metagenome]
MRVHKYANSTSENKKVLLIENKNIVAQHTEFESPRSHKVAMITGGIEVSFFTMRSVIPYGV